MDDPIMEPDEAMPHPWWTHLLWIPSGAVLAAAIAAVFSGVLRWHRPLFLIPYAVAIGSFSAAFFRWNRIDVRRLILHRWRAGLAGAVAAGVVVVASVLRQPASQVAGGWILPLDLLWSGVIYGVLDAMLITVVPVIAVSKAFASAGRTRTPLGRQTARAAGFAASLLVAGAYHAGFAEYRGPEVMGAVVGNVAFALAYVLTGSPLAPVLAHIAMHVAGVLHGPGGVVQLPPHY